MRVVLQRSKQASVTIDHNKVGKISHGFVVLVGFKESDHEAIIEKMVNKIIGLRVFSDDQGKMNLSIKDVDGQILSVSQFTLYADCKKGRRPSFIDAAKPDHATKLYDRFNEVLKQENIHVETGVFGADMCVELQNDGPVTIILDSDDFK